MKKMLLTLAGILVANLFAATSQCHAGNVVVNLSEDGLLTIQGDAEINNLYISIANDLTGALTVGAIGGTGTINGEAGPVSYGAQDVTKISVNLGRGRGALFVYFGKTITADLSIENISRAELYTAFLSDSFDLIGDISINSGRVGNRIVVEGLRQKGNLDISTGHGTDLIEFERAYQYPCLIDGSVSINTGQDNDIVEMFHVLEITGDLTVELGQGRDSFWHIGSSVVGGAVYLHGGQGNDFSLGDEDIIADEFLKIGFEN